MLFLPLFSYVLNESPLWSLLFLEDFLVVSTMMSIHNGMKAVYKILTNQDKVTIKKVYNIRCNPDLDEGFCAVRRISCACTGCVEQISKPWLPNLYKTLQPCYVIKPETCKYSSILRGYNK